MTYIQALAVIGANLYTGNCDGVWRRPLSGLVSSAEKFSSDLPAGAYLGNNYPNPFNPTTTIRYGLPHRSRILLTVFNILGQKVAELVNGDIDAGYHEVKFDGSNLASGVYFCRMRAGDFVDTKKILLTK